MTVPSAPRTTHPVRLGPMPVARRMTTHDRGFARASTGHVLDLVRNVEAWPAHLPHYRWVRMLEHDAEGGGVVEMAADRPFGPLRWPTFWRSLMEVDHARSAVRFRHIAGVTTGMEVEWAMTPEEGGTRITLVHEWDGPAWPLIGAVSARAIIGPVFVHGIAARTLAGLTRVAERAS